MSNRTVHERHEKRGVLRRPAEAVREVRAALEDVVEDKPVAATRAVAAVGRRFRPTAETTWAAFRWRAQELVGPFFAERLTNPGKAALWAVCDPFYGQLDHKGGTDAR